MTSEVVLRAPSSHTSSTPAAAEKGKVDLKAPSFEWLSGTWYVSYSTLPMWKGKQNVKITYGLSGTKPADANKMPDLTDHVQSQKEGHSKTSNIHGISKAVEVDGLTHGLAFSWRGKGWLKIASSDWEILGYGTDTANGDSNDWLVTFFSSTLFTPAGIDIYTRTTKSLSETALGSIKSTLEGLSDDKFTKTAKSIFEVPRTD